MKHFSISLFYFKYFQLSTALIYNDLCILLSYKNLDKVEKDKSSCQQ